MAMQSVVPPSPRLGLQPGQSQPIHPGDVPLASAGPITLVCVSEALDLVGAQRFLDRTRSLCRNSSCIVADLTHAEFLDSSGVRALLGLASELDSAGKQLRLVIQPGSRVERTLKLLLLLDHFEVASSLTEACARPLRN